MNAYYLYWLYGIVGCNRDQRAQRFELGLYLTKDKTPTDHDHGKLHLCVEKSIYQDKIAEVDSTFTLSELET